MKVIVGTLTGLLMAPLLMIVLGLLFRLFLYATNWPDGLGALLK